MVRIRNTNLCKINKLVGKTIFYKNDIFVDATTLYEIMQPVGGKGKKHNYHGLNPETILDALQNINVPLCILNDGKNKYFHLVKKMVTNYRIKGREFFNNNAHYYVNLLFLIYSDYENDNITLSLNEKLILELINHENRFFIDSHQTQIIQLLLRQLLQTTSSSIIT